MYLSGHPMSQYLPLYDRYQAVRIARLQSAETNAPYDNAWVDIFGILADKKMRTTKRGDILALLTVEDMTGSMEVMCFGRVYSQVSAKLVPGEPLFFRGRVSVREEDDTKMVLGAGLYHRGAPKRPAPPPAAEPGKGRQRQARGRTPPKGRAGCSSGCRRWRENSGKSFSCCFPFLKGRPPCWCGPPIPGRLLKAGEEYNTDANPVLLGELRRVLGQENVALLPPEAPKAPPEPALQ